MRKREAGHGRAVAGVRASAAAAAVLLGCVTACGNEGERPSPRVVEESGPDRGTVALIAKTNDVMAGSSFAASGTNSAFGGAEQDITWDPEHGFHMTVRADATEADMYCRDGRNYISAPLLGETLKSRDRQLTVPDELAGQYVTVQAKSCDAYFEIPESAERAPEQDTRVDGVPTKAVAVGKAGSADVYHIAATGRPRLLKLDAELDGLRTTMTYEGYGERYGITLPPEERQIKMSEFQAAVLGSGGG